MGCINSKAPPTDMDRKLLRHQVFESNPYESKLLKSKESIPFPKQGVKVSFLTEFVETYCGGIYKIEGWTTSNVSDKIVKPVSAASKLSFCDFLKSTDESSSVETAAVYISHGNIFEILFVFFFYKIDSILYFSVAWKYKFLDVVNAIQYHFRDAPETVIWFDLFR